MNWSRGPAVLVFSGGGELRLLPDSRVPLTREKLREEIGSRGFVYDRAADYRRAVDEHLFGLGAHR